MPPSKSVAARSLKTAGVVVGVVVVLAVAVIGWMVHQVNAPENGERAAAEVGRERAAQIAAELEPGYSQPVDAENLARRVADEAGVVVLAWEGYSGSDDGAVVEFAVRAEVRDTSGEQRCSTPDAPRGRPSIRTPTRPC